jgi:hypothetical protein
MFRRQKPYWIAASVAAALILAVSLVGGYRDIRRKQAQLGDQKRSLGRRQQLVAEIEAIRAGSAHIESMAEPVRRLVEVGPALRETVALIGRHKASNDWITVITDGVSYFEPEPLAPDPDNAREPLRAAEMRRRRRDAAGEPPPGLGSVIVEGYTRRSDLSTVKALIARLAEMKGVESADLLGDDKLVSDPAREARVGARTARRFVIDVRFRTP